MKLFGTFLAICSGLCAQVIEGTVVDSVTGAPISGASVQIESARTTPYQAVSDAQGAFRIEGVADGAYTAFALKTGFQTVQDEAARRPFRVVAGLDPVQLKLALIPRGRISGQVLDSDNHPVAGSDVWLLQSNGNGQSATADATGGFSFEVAPGSYYLSARPPSQFAPPAPLGDQHYAWSKTWFPGVTQAAEAQKIAVRPGVELADQNVKLRAVNAYAIHGQIRETNGDPAPKLTVKLTRADDQMQPLVRTAISAKDGSFEFADVYDGDWRLTSEQSGDVILRAFAAISIAGRDAEDVEVRLDAPFSVPVEFVLQTSDSTVKIPGHVFLGPEGGGFNPGGAIDKDGRIGGVYPGRYQVNFLPPTGYYAASITLGDREILGQTVEIGSGSAPIRIVFKADGGTIRGTVEDCGNATIAVTPEDPAIERGNLSFVPFARCAEDGHFEFHGLPPGRYYALALAQLDDDKSAFWSSFPSLINKAVSVEVTAGQTSTVELKVLSSF
jgi:5-hydroxyisourate hydrolase-like protein (transthyretin family)